MMTEAEYVLCADLTLLRIIQQILSDVSEDTLPAKPTLQELVGGAILDVEDKLL